jgi:hypothetical protein
VRIRTDPTHGPAVREPEVEDKLYETLLKMRDLLEGYAPSWYSDDLRERVETVVQQIER